MVRVVNILWGEIPPVQTVPTDKAFYDDDDRSILPLPLPLSLPLALPLSRTRKHLQCVFLLLLRIEEEPDNTNVGG